MISKFVDMDYDAIFFVGGLMDEIQFETLHKNYDYYDGIENDKKIVNLL